MSDKTECKFYVAVDENGDWNVNADYGEAIDSLSGSMRCVEVVVLVTPPKDAEITIDVPDIAATAPTVTVSSGS